ncbi:hypothetical protein VTO73DRAFT_6644 [Trametes versicolor]
MDSRPTLNYDILLEVMNFSSRPDCSRFMRTCRFFYTHGCEALLSHPIFFYREDQLIDLINFLRIQGTKRFKYVHSLDMSICNLTESTALQLATALPLMTKLEELRIPYSESLILSHPGLAEAISSLTSIRVLRLGYMGELAIEMLQSLRSSLVKVYLELYTDFDDDEVPEEDRILYHYTALLGQSESTLQELCIGKWYTVPDIPPSPMLVFPKMRKLTLPSPIFPRRATSYANERHMLDSVLSYGRPRKLVLSNPWPWKLHDPASDVFAAFRGPGGSRLEALEMKSKLGKDDCDLEVGIALEGLLSALAANAPLRQLRLSIGTDDVDPRPSDLKHRDMMSRYRDLVWLEEEEENYPTRPLQDLQSYPLNLAERSTNDFDMEDYIRRFVTAVPTLQKVEFTLGGPRWRTRTRDPSVILSLELDATTTASERNTWIRTHANARGYLRHHPGGRLSFACAKFQLRPRPTTAPVRLENHACYLHATITPEKDSHTADPNRGRAQPRSWESS